MCDGSGRTNHRPAVANMHKRLNANSQGFRRPPWSAIAPKMGAAIAAASALTLLAWPQSAVPSSRSGATAVVT